MLNIILQYSIFGVHGQGSSCGAVHKCLTGPLLCSWKLLAETFASSRVWKHCPRSDSSRREKSPKSGGPKSWLLSGCCRLAYSSCFESSCVMPARLEHAFSWRSVFVERILCGWRICVAFFRMKFVDNGQVNDSNRMHSLFHQVARSVIEKFYCCRKQQST